MDTPRPDVGSDQRRRARRTAYLLVVAVILLYLGFIVYKGVRG